MKKRKRNKVVDGYVVLEETGRPYIHCSRSRMNSAIKFIEHGAKMSVVTSLLDINEEDYAHLIIMIKRGEVSFVYKKFLNKIHIEIIPDEVSKMPPLKRYLSKYEDDYGGDSRAELPSHSIHAFGNETVGNFKKKKK